MKNEDGSKLTILERVLDLAASKKARYFASRVFATHSEISLWAQHEFSHFFLSGIYGDATGALKAEGNELQKFVVTDESFSWLQKRCPNAYWLWALIESAVLNAPALPLTVLDFEKGLNNLFKEVESDVSRLGWRITGLPINYSGNFKAWHIMFIYDRQNIVEFEGMMQLGLETGLILFQSIKPAFSKVPIRTFATDAPFYLSTIQFNPLFRVLSELAPETA